MRYIPESAVRGWLDELRRLTNRETGFTLHAEAVQERIEALLATAAEPEPEGLREALNATDRPVGVEGVEKTLLEKLVEVGAVEHAQMMTDTGCSGRMTIKYPPGDWSVIRIPRSALASDDGEQADG